MSYVTYDRFEGEPVPIELCGCQSAKRADGTVFFHQRCAQHGGPRSTYFISQDDAATIVAGLWSAPPDMKVQDYRGQAMGILHPPMNLIRCDGCDWSEQAHWHGSPIDRAAEPEVEKLENKILDTIAEFGDQPEQCLSIINELIDQRQHFRAHPNAPRVEDPA